MGWIGKIGTAPLQSSLAEVMGEALAGVLKQLLKVARRDIVCGSNVRQREVGIAHASLDVPRRYAG